MYIDLIHMYSLFIAAENNNFSILNNTNFYLIFCTTEVWHKPHWAKSIVFVVFFSGRCRGSCSFKGVGRIHFLVVVRLKFLVAINLLLFLAFRRWLPLASLLHLQRQQWWISHTSKLPSFFYHVSDCSQSRYHIFRDFMWLDWFHPDNPE